MKIAFWIFTITFLVMFNIYTDGRYLEGLEKYYNPRYYRMGIVFGVGLILYFITVRFPTYFCMYLLRVLDWIRIWPTSGTGGGGGEGGGRSGGGRQYAKNTSATASAFDIGRSDSGDSAIYKQEPRSHTLPNTQNRTHANDSEPDLNSMTGKMAYAIRRLTESAKIPTGRRTVSETKKKFVAARQQWKCKTCGCILPAWFEVDHIQRVERGGTNHPDNLVALCRECHGKKTAYENL